MLITLVYAVPTFLYLIAKARAVVEVKLTFALGQGPFCAVRRRYVKDSRTPEVVQLK